MQRTPTKFFKKIPISLTLCIFAGFSGVSTRISAQAAPDAEVVCRFAGTSYPEGAAIHGDRIPEQMCVRAPGPGPRDQSQKYHAEWVRMSAEARERSNQIVTLAGSAEKDLTVACQPASADKKDFCGCGGSPSFAPGSLVRSDRGAMRCDQGEWRPVASCVADGKEYPEGTVIQAGAAEQMCIRLLNAPFDRPRETHLDWVRTSKELRERSSKSLFVILNSALCKPTPARNPGLCGCEGFSDFAPKSVMQSANGPIRCEDGAWHPLAKDSGGK